MSDSAEDQIHPATVARRQQARLDGDVPKSFELAASLQMIGALLAAYLLLGQIGNWIRGWTAETWSAAGSDLSVNTNEVTSQIQNMIGGCLAVLVPILLLLLLVGVASHWIQTGPMFLSKRISPDPSRLGVGNWKRQVFSISTLAFLFVGIPKSLIAGVVVCLSSWIHRNEFFALANFPTDTMVEKLFALILTITFHVAFALLLASAADYWLKFTSYQRRIRMTDQQLRDELRMQNGDPQIRARQRQIRRT